MKSIIGLLVLVVIFLGFSFSDASGQIQTNNVFVLEGSGFAVTEEIIRISNLDLSIITNTQSKATTNFKIEDGFISLVGTEYLVTDLNGSFLRDGQFIRISGFVEDITGETATIKFFGRLIEESKSGSVYGFTGRINITDDSFKILYTTKLEKLSDIVDTESESTQEQQLTIKILKGSSTQGIASSYIESGLKFTERSDGALRASYFSHDRITVEPGTTITIVNGDIVPHRIVSGTGLGQHSSVLSGSIKICSEISVNLPKGFSVIPPGSEGRDCDFNFDGRINTGEIQPNESVTVTFEERGFYRLIDPDYPWMRIDGYVFANIDSLVLGTTKNQQGN